MNTVLQVVHCFAALIVMAEALNKLERSHPFGSGLVFKQRVFEALKALSWFPLAIGAGGAIAGPLLYLAGIPPDTANHILRTENLTLAEVSVMVGFATLIIRTRIKEG